jgi:hypothetical protein
MNADAASENTQENGAPGGPLGDAGRAFKSDRDQYLARNPTAMTRPIGLPENVS